MEPTAPKLLDQGQIQKLHDMFTHIFKVYIYIYIIYQDQFKDLLKSFQVAASHEGLLFSDFSL